MLVAGASGAGKTSAARRIAETLCIPRHELDALHHGPGWVKRSEFESDVAAFSVEPAWVCEWQYRSVRSLLLERAEMLVWIDVPIRTQMWQLVMRTLRHRFLRQELWNGNREGPLWGVFTERDHVIRWGWRTRNSTAERIPLVVERHPALPVIRVRSRHDLDRWLAAVRPGGTTRAAEGPSSSE